jgi:glutamate decarboxylase
MTSGAVKALVADWQSLQRTFIRPEDDAAKSVLLKYMEQILFGLHEFLKQHVGITEEVSLKFLASRFMDTRIRENPEKKLADVITDLIEDVAPFAVNVASPYFIGHMTAAVPFFMVHLKTIVAALNQNVVKMETSKVVSVVEKQVLGKLHRLIYQMDDQFYDTHVQNADTCLGGFIEDGTLANITALWVARNAIFPPGPGFEGIEQEGVQAAFQHYGVDRCVVLVSRLSHYSLRKAGGLLGIGNRNVMPMPVTPENRIDLGALRQMVSTLTGRQSRTKILAVVGIAGTTETGTIDPLADMADLCESYGIHFHVDAAWGGPTLLSKKYRGLLNGIERADSVTMDGHKQFYMPMTCGMVYFRDPSLMNHIRYYANYVIRRGSVDLGMKSLAGSREAVSLILDSALKIMGSQGYALLIEHSIETAKAFAEEIRSRKDFELITEPELNILTYRLCPAKTAIRLLRTSVDERSGINMRLNDLNRRLQRIQREAGNSFVSRTTLRVARYPGEDIVVLRAVIMNPMTTPSVVCQILDEQEDIYRTHLADEP